MDDDRLIDEAVALAESLLEGSAQYRTRSARRREARMAKLLADERGKAFALALTDEVLRSRDPRLAAQQFRHLVHDGAPTFLGPVDRALLKLGAVLARPLPRLVMPLVTARLRSESRPVILPAERSAFAAHAQRRRNEAVRLNVNVLGEAILGDEEAGRRLDAVIERLRWPEIDYVSVKISAITSQIDVVAFDWTVARIAERLERLFSEAAASTPPKFVNLDMEEYRDLHLTTAAFRTVLDQPAFHSLDAGIVLQAYLPDSYAVLDDLCHWAHDRHARGGGRFKVRIVKGANLAMEQVEAELHGWEQAPYTSKAAVDANYKRMVERILDPRLGDSVRVGVASHNLFDVAWALVLARATGQERRLEIEMLEGMAEPQARAVRDRVGGLLLYAPVARRGDFESTIAYLVRRLDENTAPENFLRHVFSMTPRSEAFNEQRRRFEQAVRDRHDISAEPRRTQDRRKEQRCFAQDEPFRNEPDTDFTVAGNREWLRQHLTSLAASPPPFVPASIGGSVVELSEVVDGIDPSSGEVAYRYALADTDAVERAVATAKAAQPAWAARPTADRRAVLLRVAEVMAARRGETVAVMTADAGKTPAESDPEVSEAIDFARYYARSLDTVDQLTEDGLRFEPLGAVVVASPWNFPYAIPSGGVLAALAAGNAVILKPAPETVLTAWHIAAQCWEAGVPKDVLQFVPCPDDEVGRRLVTHPDVGGVILTGAWETARLFRSWRPDLRLHAETSGKNAIVVTATADLDNAVRDIVRSAFGHAGQKCSAASLAIVETAVYEDASFRRQLRDAVTSLHVGSAWAPGVSVGPLIRPPTGPLAAALTRLDPGEEWLVEPRMIDGNPRLWSPGVKLGVRPGSTFHLTECFGPVLGVMAAHDLDDAIRLQNAPLFGLTGGIQALDDTEIERWLAQVEVGNAYINRPITGAIVQRQPFGGWKRSVVGPAAKAGGPNYLLTLGRWRTDERRPGARAAGFRDEWDATFAAPHDATGLRAESNVLRYRPHSSVALRTAPGVGDDELAIARLAASTAGVRLQVSSAEPRHDVEHVVVEDDDAFVARIRSRDVDKVRWLGAIPTAARRRLAEADIVLDDEPVVEHPRIELLRWVREQAVSRTLHRYGNVPGRAGSH